MVGFESPRTNKYMENESKIRSIIVSSYLTNSVNISDVEMLIREYIQSSIEDNTLKQRALDELKHVLDDVMSPNSQSFLNIHYQDARKYFEPILAIAKIYSKDGRLLHVQ